MKPRKRTGRRGRGKRYHQPCDRRREQVSFSAHLPQAQARKSFHARVAASASYRRQHGGRMSLKSEELRLLVGAGAAARREAIKVMLCELRESVCLDAVFLAGATVIQSRNGISPQSDRFHKLPRRDRILLLATIHAAHFALPVQTVDRLRDPSHSNDARLLGSNHAAPSRIICAPMSASFKQHSSS